jgi:RNA polymerase sigma-70 factor (ECF subfamily)
MVEQILSANELKMHIERCAVNIRESQKKIYNSYYGFAITVCMRYTDIHENAVEILNDGFLKIFKDIHRFKPAYEDVVISFNAWVRRIMIYTAIDHFRKNSKFRLIESLDEQRIEIYGHEVGIVEKISCKEIIELIQQLSPSYKTIFNLYVMEGFTHNEIAGQLGISVGASKSGLARARIQLQKILRHRNQIFSYTGYGEEHCEIEVC